MGGKTSSECKTRYNKKKYEEIKLRVYKGEKDQIKAFATAKGMSMNEFISKAISKAMKTEGT